MPWIVWCRKIVWCFGFFVCLLYLFLCGVGSWRGLIFKRPNWLSEVLQLHQSLFVEILILLWLFETFVSKTNLGFWALLFFTKVFWSYCSSVFVNTGHNPFAVSYKLTLLTVLASIFSSVFLLLLLTAFIFVHFWGFLFSFWFITIIVSPIGFKVLRKWILDSGMSQLLPMEI